MGEAGCELEASGSSTPGITCEKGTGGVLPQAVRMGSQSWPLGRHFERHWSRAIFSKLWAATYRQVKKTIP